MGKKNIAFHGFLHALGATVYVILVVTLIQHAQAWFGAPKDNMFDGVAILMLFVSSAAMMGSIVFLRPVLWYMNGKKREALMLLTWTIASLFAITALVFAGLAVGR